MTNLSELKYTEGSRKKNKRRCRGIGSGLGKNGGSGSKGQNSRSGGGVALGFEGGQNPLWRRLPKRGFKAYKDNTYAIVNLETLEKNFKENDEVNLTILVEKGLVKNEYNGLKVLAKGELSKKLTIKANKFSKEASKKITAIGGKAEEI